MATEQQLPQERIKELAAAAIAKRTRGGTKPGDPGKAVSLGKARKPSKELEAALEGLVKDLSDFYGFAAVPRTTREHGLMAGMVSQSWVPLKEYERQVQYKEEAEERNAELQRENADLRARIEQRIEEVPRLKAVIRAALARLIVDTNEKHIREEWALLLWRRVDTAREILQGELSAPAADQGA